MALTDIQTKSLKAKLKRRHVKTRESYGRPISYVEGWHAIAEANRIFGFDSWDRQTVAPQCHWAQLQSGETLCFYSAKVRITVRAADTVTVREGIGTGFGRASQPELAHDTALKAAETDATKRALATFGNPFGLALYDRDQAHVTRGRAKVATEKRPSLQPPELVLTDAEGKEVRFSHHATFVDAALREILRLNSTDRLMAFWSRNSATLEKLWTGSAEGKESARQLADALKERACEIGQPKVSKSNGAGQDPCHRADRGKLSDPERKACPRPGAPSVCRRPTLPHLWAAAGASASSAVCPATSDGHESFRRVHGPRMQHAS
jgi:DNA recombination protein Rad52